MTSPRVSVVTATYNRSNVLRYTIESVLASTFTDFEMIVVGDACTDDTEEVVRSFGDPRLRFVNLLTNSGEQAGPNNEGIRLARGEFVAFINHDDLWTPEHLSVCLEAIGSGDFVATLGIGIDEHEVPHLTGVCRRGLYEPHAFLPASTWLVRRTLFEDDAAGPWRSARELHVAPSQEWLFRASKKGYVLRSIPRVTTLLVFSGNRKGSYVERQFEENARYAERLHNDPSLIPDLLQSIAVRLTAEERGADVMPHVSRAMKAAARKITSLAGVHPVAARHAVVYRRRGGFLDSLRRTRGLPPLPRGGTP
jgi:glycosyltransferase involved in cell wall biosynthesis